MNEYTKQDAEFMLEKMRTASAAFYLAATRTGAHSFIEFTGLMNEYINVCSSMTAAGDTSWVHANTHSGESLAMAPHHVAYLAEKLDCIYGPTLRASPALKAAFEGTP